MKKNESNFYFLKEINRNIFKLANTAEELYRDEYFQQCMTQTRTYAENVCRELLNGNYQPNDTFDTMLANLDDYLINCNEKRELISDLYFLKKVGNQSVHTRAVDKDGIKALECLQRAFEVAIMYYSAKNGKDVEVAKLLFDEELLATGSRSKTKNTLKEKYLQEKAREDEIERREKVKNVKKSSKSKFDKYPKVSKNKPTPFFTLSRKIKIGLWILLFTLSLLILGTVKLLLIL